MTATIDETRTETVAELPALFAVVDRDALAPAVKTVSAAIARRGIPILSAILMRAEGDGLRLSATNLEIGLSAMIPARVDNPLGAVAVDAKLFADLLSTLPSGDVSLFVDAERRRLIVATDRNRATINGFDPDDFPVVPRDGTGDAFDLDAQTLRDTIHHVAFSAAGDDSRPVLASLFVRFGFPTLTMAAADGFRLSVAERETFTAPPLPDGAATDILLPIRSARELAKLIGKHAGPVRLTLTEQRTTLAVTLDNLMFTSRLISGTFPDFRQIIPRESKTRVTLDREALRRAVKRAASFAKDNNDVVRFTLTGNDPTPPVASIAIQGGSAKNAEVESVIDAELWFGPEITFALQSGYVLDALGSLTTETAELALNKPTEAVVLRPTGDATITHVLMPMVMGAN